MIAQVIAAAVGIGVMAAPSLFGYGGLAADIDHVIGPLAASIGIMAASQILRAVRWVHLGSGVVLLVSVVLVDRTGVASACIAGAGVVLVGAAFVRGQLEVSFGGGWSARWKDDTTTGK